MYDVPKKLILDAAKRTGFTLVGVTSADRIDEKGHLKEWLARDFNGAMSYMKREPQARCDPKSLLPSANSVICLGMEYGEFGVGGGGKTEFNVNTARFARGHDYHPYVKERLKIFWRHIKSHAPKAQAKMCVDTSPILEKGLAVRAGIGWQGKNSLVINPEHGSYFVLGEIITDLKIETDSPLNMDCGECDLCISACPLGAIVEAGVLDARRCLSYFTTTAQNNDVPKEYLPYLKDGQFGCDICQEVCPYNSKGENSKV